MAFKKHQSKSDKNFRVEIIGALKNRCGGYYRDKAYPQWHYANHRGLRVALYDLNKVGQGHPDADLWVSWLCVKLEVKQERPPVTTKGTKGRHTEVMDDDQYYRAQLEETEVFFRNNHTGLYMIVWEQNQVYELICRMADLVFWVEEQAALPTQGREFLSLFFPKIFPQLVSSVA